MHAMKPTPTTRSIARMAGFSLIELMISLTIGLVIVSDEHQGNGIGRRLMNLCVGAAAHRTPILNATAAGAPLPQG